MMKVLHTLIGTKTQLTLYSKTLLLIFISGQHYVVCFQTYELTVSGLFGIGTREDVDYDVGLFDNSCDCISRIGLIGDSWQQQQTAGASLEFNWFIELFLNEHCNILCVCIWFVNYECLGMYSFVHQFIESRMANGGQRLIL